ncbi:MAG: SDR family oxidoreductase, partial [Halioglobus sp.]|nr:SDR family oxidoreductase [Halioglobus sp.]
MPVASDMSGKATIVTGAASGLGRATALKLAAAGADLCLVDINPAGLEETAGEARDLGVSAFVQAVDLSNTDNCAPVVAACVAEFGRLDALCNVAAVFLPDHSHEVEDERWDMSLAVNLTAPFKLIRASIPHLLESDGAVV